MSDTPLKPQPATFNPKLSDVQYLESLMLAAINANDYLQAAQLRDIKYTVEENTRILVQKEAELTTLRAQVQQLEGERDLVIKVVHKLTRYQIYGRVMNRHLSMEATILNTPNVTPAEVDAEMKRLGLVSPSQPDVPALEAVVTMGEIRPGQPHAAPMETTDEQLEGIMDVLVPALEREGEAGCS